MSATELEFLTDACSCGCKTETVEPIRTIETGCGCESATPGSELLEAVAAVKDNGCDNPKCTCDPCTCPPPCRCGEV